MIRDSMDRDPESAETIGNHEVEDEATPASGGSNGGSSAILNLSSKQSESELQPPNSEDKSTPEGAKGSVDQDIISAEDQHQVGKKFS